MALVMTSGPASEPVTVAEAKAFLRIDTAAEDVLLGSLLITARLHIEAALDLALITQSWKLVLDRWPKGDTVAIPLRPVQGIGSVIVRDSAGDAVIVHPSSYIVEAAGTPARLVNKAGAWPTPGQRAGGIEIAFTAGFGATVASVPEPLRHAVLLLAAHWYEHRDPIEIGSAATRIPAAVSELLMPYRMKRL